MTVDAAGYRERREAALHRMADRAAAEALRYERAVELEPMRAARAQDRPHLPERAQRRRDPQRGRRARPAARASRPRAAPRLRGAQLERFTGNARGLAGGIASGGGCRARAPAGGARGRAGPARRPCATPAEARDRPYRRQLSRPRGEPISRARGGSPTSARARASRAGAGDRAAGRRVDLVESAGAQDRGDRPAGPGAPELDNARAVTARAEEWARCRRARRRARGLRRRHGAGAGARWRCWSSTRRRCCARAASLVAWKGARRRGEERGRAPRGRASWGWRSRRSLRVVPFAGAEHRHLHVSRRSRPRPSGFPRRPGWRASGPLAWRRARRGLPRFGGDRTERVEHGARFRPARP